MQKQLLTFAFLLSAQGFLAAATLEVGPGKRYPTPCAAIAAAAPGDTILIDASGSYTGDVCSWKTNGLLLRGVNGRAKIDAGGRHAGGKGIWVIGGNNTTVENIEFSGAKVPDGNGAGIRLEAKDLTVRNSYFHHNQAGLLGGTGGEVLIEYSEFAYNGRGNGYTHNIYVGSDKFTLRFSYSHHAIGGQLVKTRAMENHIVYNRLTTEDGTANYEVDISNGGLTYLIGNIIQQGPGSPNSNIVTYMAEGPHATKPDHRFFVVNNTFVNDKSYGTFITISSATNTPAVIRNNLFVGPGGMPTQAVFSNNLFTADPLFANRAAFDYRLTPGSPAINAGTLPGVGADQPLGPAYHYVHATCGETRVAVGPIDIGALEYGSVGTRLPCAPSTGTGLAELQSFTVDPPSVAARNSTGTVVLTNPAPPGGIVLTLSSSNPAVASLPSPITVAAGSYGVTFPVTAGAVSTSKTVTLTVSYAGVSRNALLTVNPLPAISGVQAKNITASTATIVWNTNVPATTQVQYGTTAAYGAATPLNSAKVQPHSVVLAGLLASKLYHYRVISVDASGATAASADLTFQTTASGSAVSVLQTQARGFDPLTVSWSAPLPRGTWDFVGLYVTGASDSAQLQRAIIGTKATSGILNSVAPAAPGQYEFRIVLGGVAVARSAPFTVTKPVGFSMTAPAAVPRGGTLVINWTSPAGRPTTDWIGLFTTGGQRLWYKYTRAATGSMSNAAPAAPGQYELRFYAQNSWVLITKATITVQ